MTEKSCQVCGKTIPRRGGRYTCSYECRDARATKARPVVQCQVCGKDYVLARGKGKKICSMECVGENNRRRILNDPEHHEQIECGTCRKTFTATKSSNREFCSRKCRGSRIQPVKIQLRDGSLLVVRSRWEAAFIHDYLEKNDVKWEYEPRFFKLSNGKRYTPDFYLPNDDLWIEVKGFFDEKSQEKTQLFKQLGWKLLLADGNVLRQHFGLNLDQKYLDMKYVRD